MKEKSNATLRRAASLRCRTDAAIARLGKAVACYQRGAMRQQTLALAFHTLQLMRNQGRKRAKERLTAKSRQPYSVRF